MVFEQIQRTTNGDITVDGPLVTAAALAAAAAVAAALAAALAVAPFAPEFDDIAIDDGCVDDDDDDNDGVNLKYLQQSQNFIVIACFVRSKLADTQCTLNNNKKNEIFPIQSNSILFFLLR